MVDEKKKRTRLVVDITPELRRRIKVAAARSDTSITQYVVDILEDSVPSGDTEALDNRGLSQRKRLRVWTKPDKESCRADASRLIQWN